MLRFLILIVIIFFYHLSVVCQENLVKNGDFKVLTYNYNRLKIKRVDSLFSSPAFWDAITRSGIGAVPSNVDLTQIKFRDEKTKKEYDHIQSINERFGQEDSVFVYIPISISRQSSQNPFSRGYLLGELEKPLKKNKQYALELHILLTSNFCLGLKKLGIKLDSSSFNKMDLSPRIDSSVISFDLPEQYDQWLILKDSFRAKGGEEYLMIGAFMPESDLKLYRQGKRFKRKCPPNKYGVQVIQISKVKIFDLVPEKVEVPKRDTVEKLINTVLNNGEFQKSIKIQTICFESNDYISVDYDWDGIRMQIKEATQNTSDYQILLKGYTDDLGTKQNNFELSEKRALKIKEVLIKKGFSAEKIKIQAIGEAQPKSNNSTAKGRADNRRVEIIVQYL